MRYFPPLQDARLIDYWRIIALRKWMIVSMVVIATALTALEMSLRPTLYDANVTIIATVPAWQDKLGRLVRPVIPNVGEPFRPIKVTLYESFYWELFSRVLADAVIEELDLKKHYHVNSISQARAILMGNRSIQLTREYTLQVTVVDRDPTMAVEIANAHARQLDRLDRKLLVESASFRRRFLQQGAEEALTELTKAEKAWTSLGEDKKKQAAAQMMTGLPSVSGDEKKTDKAQQASVGPPQALIHGGLMKLRLIEAEVELFRLRQFATPGHPAVNQIEAQIHALRRILERIEQGDGMGAKASGQQSSPAGGQGHGLFPPLNRLPELTLNSRRLTGEVNLQAKLYVHWRDVLADAMVEESLDLPRVWVLEGAIPSERPVKVWQTLLVAGGLALVLGLILAFLLSYLDRIRRAEESPNPVSC